MVPTSLELSTAGDRARNKIYKKIIGKHNFK